MPFTFAHPAVLIPFKFLPRKYYSWTGLIIGATVPDFEAFIRLGGEKRFSHSWLGMFTFDLPLGLLLAIIFHTVVFYPLVNQLPAFLAKRFFIFADNDWLKTLKQRFGIVILSLLFGIFTHLIWDRLTHTDTYTYHEKAGIQLAPSTEAEIRAWLQMISSIIGLLLIVWQVLKLKMHKNITLKRWKFFWPLVMVIATGIYFVRMSFPLQGDDKINTAIAGVLWGMFVASFFYKKRFAH